MIVAISLDDPARGLTSEVKPRDGVAFQGLEVAATVREDAEDESGRDGTADTTAYLGAAAVALRLAFYDPATRGDLMDEFAAYLAPYARPYLTVDDDAWASPRRIMLRFDSHAQPVETRGGATRRVQYAWKAPRGLWEDTTAVVWTIGADVPDTTGLADTASYGVRVTAAEGFRFIASTSSGGAALINVPGNARPRWRAKFYGPAVGPKLTRDDAGQEIAFTDRLWVPSGDYVEVDQAARSALYLSDESASRLNQLDWAASEWFELDAGPNRLRYHATSSTGPSSVCEVTCYPVWMP